MATNSILAQDLDEIATSELIDWDALNNKTIFLTGGTGLIGSLIVRAIQFRNKVYHSNIKVKLLVRNIERAHELYGEDDNISYINGSVEDINIEDIGIDFIIHAASPTKSKYFIEYPAETFTTIVLGTQKILELARANNVEGMVYLSSMEMYGTMKSDNVTEKDQGYIDIQTARSCYQEGKRAAESYCYYYGHQYDVPVKVVRIAQTFGPGIDVLTENRVYKSFADSILQKKNIVLKSSGSTIINYGYTTDVVKGIFCVLQKGKKGTPYNLVGEKTGMTIKESAEWLVSEFGEEQVRIVFDIPKENAGFAPDNGMVLDNESIKTDTGWYPMYDVKSGYIRLLKYMEEEYKNPEIIKKLTIEHK